MVVITTAKRSFFRWKLHIISLFSIEEENPTLFSLSYLVSFNVDPKLIFFYSIHWWTVNLEFPLFPLPDQTSYSLPCSWLVIDRTVALHPKAAVPLKIRLFSLCIQLFLDRFSAGIMYRKGGLESLISILIWSLRKILSLDYQLSSTLADEISLKVKPSI